jgi:hypothetical protein
VLLIYTVKSANSLDRGKKTSTNKREKTPYIAVFNSECMLCSNVSAGFTYRLDRLKPRASKSRGPPTKVYNIFNTVIGLSHLCCHNILYFLNNHS